MPPYLPTDTPNDLPVPSTSRVLLPRSRATSLARSEARSASGSRPGSRASSTRSRTSSTSNPRLAGLISRREAYSIPPSSMGESLAADGGGQELESSQPLTPAEPTGGGIGNSSYEGQSWTEDSDWNHGYYGGGYTPNPDELFPNEGASNWPTPDDFGHLSEPLASGSSSQDHLDANFDDLHGNPWMRPADNLDWQTGRDDFRPPLRLGLASGSGSGSGASSSKRKRSPSGPPADPMSQRSWPSDFDAEREVAGQLLFDNTSSYSQSQFSSGISSQENPVKDRKGKGKAKERAKTPDPESIIVIPDTPPTSHAEVLPKEPTKPKPDPLSSYTCPICFSPPTNATLTPCGHICCGACLFAAVKTTMLRTSIMGAGTPLNDARCPVCRATIPGWDGKGAGVIGLKARAIFRL